MSERDQEDLQSQPSPSNGVTSELIDGKRPADDRASQPPEPPLESESQADVLNDLIKDFLAESYENLDQLDRDLRTLEQDPSSHSALASGFRTIHTIKGTCGFFGLSKLGSVAHAGESLLIRLRDGKLHFTPEIATGLLALEYAVRRILNNVELQGNEGSADYSPLIETLIRLQQEPMTPQPPPNGGKPRGPLSAPDSHAAHGEDFAVPGEGASLADAATEQGEAAAFEWSRAA